MRVAVMFPIDSPAASWNMGRGIVATLKRMGVDATAITMPTETNPSKELLALAHNTVYPLSELAKHDGIIVSGPEHIGAWIDELYNQYEWKQLQIPKAAWMHESCRREDYTIDVEAIRWIAEDWFFPAIQDAELHDQEVFMLGHSHYLPFGVDTGIFHLPQSPMSWAGSHPDHESFPDMPHRREDYDIAFMGLLYPKRQIYMRALGQHHPPPVRVATVEVRDIHGYDYEESARRYAASLRSIKVFLNLPALSQLLVGKVFEVLACGGFLLTPMLPSDGGTSKNMLLFESGQHLMYYRASHLGGLVQMMREYPSKEKDEERARIAAAGCREVHEKHTLEKRLEVMLAKMGLFERVREAVQ